jgi:hypothetical protein
MNDTAIIKLSLSSETTMPTELLRKMGDAIVEIVRQVIEEEGNGQEIKGFIQLTAFGEAKIISGEIDAGELPPVVAALFGQGIPRVDEFGATSGCDCPRCQAIRRQARTEIGGSGLIFMN